MLRELSVNPMEAIPRLEEQMLKDEEVHSRFEHLNTAHKKKTAFFYNMKIKNTFSTRHQKKKEKNDCHIFCVLTSTVDVM